MVKIKDITIDWKSIINVLLYFAIIMVVILSLIGIISNSWIHVCSLVLGIKALIRPSHNTVIVGLTLIISAIIGFIYV